jgi:hypothetical protein
MVDGAGSEEDGRGTVYFVGVIVFAALAILLVVVFVRKWRRSND